MVTRLLFSSSLVGLVDHPGGAFRLNQKLDVYDHDPAQRKFCEATVIDGEKKVVAVSLCECQPHTECVARSVR